MSILAGMAYQQATLTPDKCSRVFWDLHMLSMLKQSLRTTSSGIKVRTIKP